MVWTLYSRWHKTLSKHSPDLSRQAYLRKWSMLIQYLNDLMLPFRGDASELILMTIAKALLSDSAQSHVGIVERWLPEPYHLEQGSGY